MPFTDALIVAFSGIAVVFFLLIILWAIIEMINRTVSSIENRIVAPVPAAPQRAETVQEEPAAEEPAVAAEEPAVAAAADEPEPVQHGTYGGELLLFDVDEKTAACIMAIVSDQTRIPLNQLIFKSIRALD